MANLLANDRSYHHVFQHLAGHTALAASPAWPRFPALALACLAVLITLFVICQKVYHRQASGFTRPSSLLTRKQTCLWKQTRDRQWASYLLVMDASQGFPRT